MSEYGFYIRGDGKCAFLKGGKHIGVINCEKDAVHLAAAANTPASLPDDALGKEPVRAAREALRKLITTATLLHQNAEGCAVNHYGADFENHGEPGWLVDAQADIVAARAALALLGEE